MPTVPELKGRQYAELFEKSFRYLNIGMPLGVVNLLEGHTTEAEVGFN